MTIRKAVALTGVAAGVFSCCLRPRSVDRTPARTSSPTQSEPRPWPSRSARRRSRCGHGWPRWAWTAAAGYSWDRLDNASRPSATEIQPEWQHLAVGDELRACGPNGLLAPWRVAVLEPNRFLGLHKLTDLQGRSLDPRQPRPATYMEGLCGFQLTALPGGRSRLEIGGYQAMRPRWLARLVFDWSNVVVVWIMQAHMPAVIKRNIERVTAAPVTRVTLSEPATDSNQ